MASVVPSLRSIIATLVVLFALLRPFSGFCQQLPAMETRQGGLGYSTVFDIAYAPATAKQDILLTELRYSTADFPLLFKSLDLKPGDSVLDVGAGLGFFALPMAKAMKNQGVIYATEVDANMLSILDATAAKNGVSIVKGIHVSARGLDPAYKQHRYNKCLVAGVFQDMEDPVAFVRQLLPQFEKGALLVVVHSEAFVLHPRADTLQLAFTLRRLVEQFGTDHPIVARLPSELIRRLTAPGLGAAPDEILTGDLDAFLLGLLNDPRLVQDLLHYYTKHYVSWKEQLAQTVDPAQHLPMEWMLMRYQALNLNVPLSPEDQYLVRGLNKVLTEQTLFGGSGNGEGLVQSGAAIRHQMERAGLVFQSEQLVNSFFWVLVFRAP